MKFFKRLVLSFSVVGTLVSCSIRNEKKDNLVSGNHPVQAIEDRDLDYIPDSVDRDPFVAAVPFVYTKSLKDSSLSYRVVSDHLGGERVIGIKYKDIHAQSTIAREIILRAIRSEIAGSSIDISEINDEITWNSFIFTPYSDKELVSSLKSILETSEQDLIQYSGTVKLHYNLILSDLEHTNSIEKLVVTTRFLDIENFTSELFSHTISDSNFKEVKISTHSSDTIETLDYFETHSYELDPNFFKDAFLNHKRLVFSISDFKFNRGNTIYAYQEYVTKLKENLATIIISTQKETKRYFIVPGKSIKESLEHLGHIVELFENGEIARLDDLSTTLSPPDDIRNPDHNFLKQSILTSFNSSDLRKRTSPGQVYVFSHAKGSEIFNSYKSIQEIEEFEFSKSTKIKNLREGDLLEIHLKGEVLKRDKRTSSYQVNGQFNQLTCLPDLGSDKYGCSTTINRYECLVEYSRPEGFKFHRKINFKKDFERYLISSGGKKLNLQKNSIFSTYLDKNHLLILLRITAPMLTDRSTLKIFEAIDEQTHLTYGFERYPNCPQRKIGHQNSINQSHLEHIHDDQFKVKTITHLKFKRIGALR